MLFVFASHILAFGEGFISDERIKILHESKCYLCAKSLLELESQNFGGGISRPIRSGVFYDNVLMACQKCGSGAVYHLACTERIPKANKNNLSTGMKRKSFNSYEKVCLRCNNYTFTYDFSRIMLKLAAIPENNDLIFRYIKKLCISHNYEYASLLMLANIQEDQCKSIRNNLLISSFEDKEFFIASIDLYVHSKEPDDGSCFTQQLSVQGVSSNFAAINFSEIPLTENNPTNEIETAIVKYLNAFPAGMTRTGITPLDQAWLKLIKLFSGTNKLPQIALTILNSTNPALHEKFAQRIVWDLSKKINNWKFTEFFIKCLLSPYYSVLHPTLENKEVSAHFKNKLRFINLLERALRDSKIAQKAVNVPFCQNFNDFLQQTYDKKEDSFRDRFCRLYQIKWLFLNMKITHLETVYAKNTFVENRIKVYSKEARAIMTAIYESEIANFLRLNIRNSKETIYMSIKIFSFYERRLSTQASNYRSFLNPILAKYSKVKRMLLKFRCSYENEMLRRHL
ncbi:hypothetical protein ENBRE01_1994 [Enteropsectra breve]|nr:hypothetical protein ENBRE01_1994 [Enteropsectra breve]